jgi:hypothetical protein
LGRRGELKGGHRCICNFISERLRENGLDTVPLRNVRATHLKPESLHGYSDYEVVEYPSLDGVLERNRLEALVMQHGTHFKLFVDMPTQSTPSRRRVPFALPAKKVNQTVESSALRLLLIDDDERFLDISQQVLERKYNWHCDTALSGKAGIQWLEETSELPDLVVVDMAMPGLDGYATIKAIRDRFSDLCIVILTGVEV